MGSVRVGTQRTNKMLLIFMLIKFAFIALVSSTYPDCYTDGGQYTGTAINHPEMTLTYTAEDCQRLCQDYDSLDGPPCLGFSWVDSQHASEELRNRCTAFSYIEGVLASYHYVSGPTYC